MSSSLTVIILTRDRLEKLRVCLEHLLPQLTPGDEVLLVDTGSTDGTRQAYAQPEHPAVRLVTFDHEGSWAEMRNFGARHAHGAMAAFLDDDCVPGPGWVARGKRALADADAVGGMVRSRGIEAFPHWWHPDMGWMVGLSVPGHAGDSAGRVEYPFTANLWMRRRLLLEVPFQEMGGQLGGAEKERYVTGREDAQWWRRLRTQGYCTRFDPLLWVGHAFDPARLDLAYLRRRAQLDGTAWARREGTTADGAALAYQWWRQAIAAWMFIEAEEGSRRAHWHFHQLMRVRHGAALRELAAGRGGVARHGLWLARGAAKLAVDNIKTLVREIQRPWRRVSPLAPWVPRPKRICVVSCAYLGDQMILQSSLRGLVDAHSELIVEVLAPPSAAFALGGIERVFLTVFPALHPGTSTGRRWLAQWLEDTRPDAIVAPYLHGPWGRALMRMMRPPRPIIGFDADQGLTRQRHAERLGIKVHKNLQLHEVQNLQALWREAGVPCDPQPARLRPQPAALERVRQDAWMQAALAPGEPALVMLNPDAGQTNKEWNDDQWAAFIRLALQETRWRLAINLSRPRKDLEQAVHDEQGRIQWLRGVPLDELTATLSLCDALVTVDAGPQHLAHALGAASLTLFGPMDERRWRDYWERPIHRTLRGAPFDLTPEELRGLAPNHWVAMIDPRVAFEAARALVREQTRKGRSGHAS